MTPAPVAGMRRSRPSVFTMSNSAVSSFPRRVSRPGLSSSAPDPEPFVPDPDRGAAERREAHCLELVALVSARRHACEAWAVPRNRDAASRRSTVALSAQGPLPSPALPPDAVRRLYAVGRFRPAAAPGVPYPRLRAAVDATPAPPSGSRLRRRPLDERDRSLICYIRYVVNINLLSVFTKC